MFCQGSVNIFKNSKRDEKKLTSLCREDASWKFGGSAFANSCASRFTGLRTDSGLPRPCHIWISYEETCTFKQALQFVLMLWTKHIQKYHYMTLKWLLINIHLESKSIHWTGLTSGRIHFRKVCLFAMSTRTRSQPVQFHIHSWDSVHCCVPIAHAQCSSEGENSRMRLLPEVMYRRTIEHWIRIELLLRGAFL